MSLNPLTTTLSSGTYLIHPQVLGQIEQTVRHDVVIPVTLLSEDDILSPDLDDLLRSLVARDDVLDDEFLRILVTKPETAAVMAWKGGKVFGVRCIDPNEGKEKVDVDKLPSGPYFIVGGNLHQAWRLHSDPHAAFVHGVIPVSVTRPPSELADMAFIPTHLGVPVPSRLFFPPADNSLPLAGVRVAVGDGFALAGIMATLSSRAFESVSSPSDVSAECVRGLLQQGAVIVGKTKVAHLAGKEGDWVDGHMPFSPRGDGYQGVGGGEAGAVVGVAGYEWLDAAVGCDSAGSMLSSVQSAGVWAARTSWKSTGLGGVQSACPTLDAIAPTARSTKILTKLIRNLAPSEPQPQPTRLIYPTNLFSTGEQDTANETKFITTLEKYLGISKTDVDVAELWTRTGPEEREKGLRAWLGTAPTSIFDKEYSASFESFFEKYNTKFGPRKPYVEPRCKAHLERGGGVKGEEYAEHVRRVGLFRDWFEKEVFKGDGVVVVPVAKTEPRYRDDGSIDSINEGVAPEMLASLLQAPHVVAPFTQTPYHSRVTDTTEHLPMCAGLISPRGSDLVLVRILDRAIARAGIDTSVGVGRRAFREVEELTVDRLKINIRLGGTFWK